MGNLAAFLAVCHLMDIGFLDRGETTLWFAVIDMATAAALVIKPGLPRVVAAGFAVTITTYAVSVPFGAPTDTTFAIVWAILVLQLGVVAFGSSGNHGGGGYRRRNSHPVSLGSPAGRGNMGGIGGAQDIALFSGRE